MSITIHIPNLPVRVLRQKLMKCDLSISSQLRQMPTNLLGCRTEAHLLIPAAGAKVAKLEDHHARRDRIQQLFYFCRPLSYHE